MGLMCQHPQPKRHCLYPARLLLFKSLGTTPRRRLTTCRGEWPRQSRPGKWKGRSRAVTANVAWELPTDVSSLDGLKIPAAAANSLDKVASRLASCVTTTGQPSLREDAHKTPQPNRQAAGLRRLFIVRCGRQGGPDVRASRNVGE